MATFNARVETVETKPVFRDAFKRSRCLIPMSGYYEWQNIPSGKQPWYFASRDGSAILTGCGLVGRMENRETGERLKSSMMIITEPNGFPTQNLAPIFHGRCFCVQRVEPTGTSSAASGLVFFGGGPEYFKFIPLTWQDNEFIPVLMLKPAECGNSREEKS
jgi:hypothetical protein